jgi:small subunit ribosomal protein S9
VAEPTGVTTTSVEDDAELADYADNEFGADVPSEYTTETAQDAPGRAVAARRPVVTGNAGGTGRRKEAIARVRILPGSGQWLINGRTLDVYFPNKVHQQLVNEPFVTLGAENSFDVVALISGGGVTGQAGALRLGVTRALILVDPENRPALKKAGFLTRDARVKERKKYGLKKARKAPQYSKR